MKEFIAECTCGHRKTLPPEIGPEIKHVLHLVERLACSKCQQIVHHIFVNNDQMIYDKLLSSTCSSCEEFIPLQRLELVPGTSLCTECASLGEADIKRPPPYPSPPSEFATCPRCQSSTQMRQNGSDKSWFIGCTTYPKCRWTKDNS